MRLFLILFLLADIFAFQPLSAINFEQTGYVEICNKHEQESFDSLYASFDEFIEFLQTNPVWAQKLYKAKERFIRSKDKNYYSTEVFGFYDESQREGRSQISFYYSTHFHAFICTHYPEFNQVPEIISFLKACLEIQKPYGNVFDEAANELDIEIDFSILLKVIKYFPSYLATKPHYDGSAFSLFLDSTDNASLLLCPYKPSYTIDDFSTPQRDKNSILLIPGTLVTEFSIYPTPHIVIASGKIRYATIAFAMRPNYIAQKIELSPLPNFN